MMLTPLVMISIGLRSIQLQILQLLPRRWR
jgi:hypothetical protein